MSLPFTSAVLLYNQPAAAVNSEHIYKTYTVWVMSKQKQTEKEAVND